MSILRIEGLSCKYGSTPVLRSISATVERPELVALIGPNGAGKSTLINVIAGRLRDYEGSCLLHDVDIRKMSRPQLCRQAGVRDMNVDNPSVSFFVVSFLASIYAKRRRCVYVRFLG